LSVSSGLVLAAREREGADEKAVPLVSAPLEWGKGSID